MSGGSEDVPPPAVAVSPADQTSDREQSDADNTAAVAAVDRASDERLVETLRSLRGRTTVILVSHRPSHLALADRVFQFGQGRLLRETTAEHFARQKNELTA